MEVLKTANIVKEINGEWKLTNNGHYLFNFHIIPLTPKGDLFSYEQQKLLLLMKNE